MKKLLVLISFFYLSCSGNEAKTGKQYNTTTPNTFHITDSLLVKKKILNFLTLQQKLIKNNNITEISNYVSFPLDGDVVYFMIYGDDFYKNPSFFFEKKINKITFLKKHKFIFPPIYSKLLGEIDLSEALYTPKYYFKQKDKDGSTWDLNIVINFKNFSFKLFFNKVTKNNEEEYSVFYQYILVNDKYMLSYIGSTG